MVPPEDKEKRDAEHRKDAADIAIAVAKIQRELANIIESTARIHRRAGGEQDN